MAQGITCGYHGCFGAALVRVRLPQSDYFLSADLDGNIASRVTEVFAPSVRREITLGSARATP